MAWSGFGKLHTVEGSVDKRTGIVTERTVETAAIPVSRFVLKGSAANSAVVCTVGADAIGVSCSGGWLLRSTATETEFSDFAVGDKALVLEEYEQPVLVETDASSVTEGANISSAANGKAKVAVSTEVVNGRAIELVTSRDGTKYIRMYLANRRNDKKVI
jgi:hypothetical protein